MLMLRLAHTPHLFQTYSNMVRLGRKINHKKETVLKAAGLQAAVKNSRAGRKKKGEGGKKVLKKMQRGALLL